MTWLRELLKTSYTRLLEKQCAEKDEELARLRLENRGLVNSLLSTAGVGPIEEHEKMPKPPGGRRSLHQMQAATERESVRRLRNREEQLRNAERPDPAA